MKMTFLKWVTIVEKIAMKDFLIFPTVVQNKIRANYQAYCETTGIKPVN